jgi:hypothetical protein
MIWKYDFVTSILVYFSTLRAGRKFGDAKPDASMFLSPALFFV